MANRIQRLSSRRSSGSDRKWLWGDGPVTAGLQGFTAAGNVIVATGQAFGGFATIARIRGELVMWIEVATAVGDGYRRVYAGIGIASNDAFAVGASALPSPLLDPGWSWLWFHAGGAIVALETTEVGRGPLAAVRIPIDTKAMRKIGDNETVFAAVAADTEIGTATLTFSFTTRMGIKLA